MANECACGCGGLLPEGSTRQYKRNHKARQADAGFYDVEDYAETPDVEALTLDQAAAMTPDDPEPRDAQPVKVKTTVRVTASVRKDIEGKLALGFLMLGQTWSLADPLCGMALVDAGPAMAKNYMPLICQSPEVVRWMSKGGSFLLWVNALMATWPVIQMVFAHHIAGTIEVVPSVNGAGPVADYVVQ